MGHLKLGNTDTELFVVGGHVYFAEVSSGLKKHYYQTSTYGEACSTHLMQVLLFFFFFLRFYLFI